MAQIKIQGMLVSCNKNLITIYDSYKINNTKNMKSILNEILEIDIYQTKRNIKSLINEWKAHNFLYNHNLYVSHTKNCDFENKQKFHTKIIFFILSKIGGLELWMKKIIKKDK